MRVARARRRHAPGLLLESERRGINAGLVGGGLPGLTTEAAAALGGDVVRLAF